MHDLKQNDEILGEFNEQIGRARSEFENIILLRGLLKSTKDAERKGCVFNIEVFGVRLALEGCQLTKFEEILNEQILFGKYNLEEILGECNGVGKEL